MSIPVFTVKWSGKEFIIEGLERTATLLDLKKHLEEKTGVLVSRQKIIGLKSKGRPVNDETKLREADLKENQKIMMVGSSEDSISSAIKIPENLPEVIDDLDDETELEIPDRPVYLDKIRKRIETVPIVEITPFREDKKLLVLDIDYTLFDHRSTAETAAELKRPFLHEFLTNAYEDYEIVIWSATSMKWIEVKMKHLGVTGHPDYKIAFHLDSSYMISVWTPEKGLINCKPLGVIWGKYPQFSEKNTIMFDDVSRNFIMNPQTGLKIKPFREAHLNRDTDRELLGLSRYLKAISTLEDFSSLKHHKWKSYLKKYDARNDRSS